MLPLVSRKAKQLIVEINYCRFFPGMATQGTCEFIVPKKKRRCKMLTKSGKRFCGEHAFAADENARIPCPLDPKHSVYPELLEKHLVKCNAKLPKQFWIVENMNSSLGLRNDKSSLEEYPQSEEEKQSCTEEEEIESEFLATTKVSKELLSKVIAFAVASDSFENVVEKQHLEVEQYLTANPDLGAEKQKHLRQQSSILGHMAERNFLSETSGEVTCFAELGAGKAQLGSWVSKVAPSSSKHLLVDHAGARRKFENKVLREDPELNFERIRCGVQHLDLAQVESIIRSTSVVAFWKHLCGAATDLGIRCLVNAAKKGINIKGLALVPCCHHKSSWEEYVGQEYLLKSGFSADDYPGLKTMCSWAVSSLKSVKNGYASEEEAERKEKIGAKAKFILQMGRLEFLKQHLPAHQIALVCYVPTEVTPENVMILANSDK